MIFPRGIYILIVYFWDSVRWGILLGHCVVGLLLGQCTVPGTLGCYCDIVWCSSIGRIYESVGYYWDSVRWGTIGTVYGGGRMQFYLVNPDGCYGCYLPFKSLEIMDHHVWTVELPPKN